MFVAIPYEIQSIVKTESSLTGKSVRQLIIEKLRGQTVEKVYSPALIANLRKLDEIQSLPKNWNGNGAPKISRSLINKTKALIINLENQPQLFPTANDSIQIEYEGKDGSYLEFQISKKKKIEFFRIDRQGVETTGFIPYSSYTVRKMVEEFA